MEQLEDTRQPTNNGYTRFYENVKREVTKWTDHELIEYITDYCDDLYYDFIMADLKAYYCLNPNIMQSKLGGIPNLLIDLFEPQNYLTYFWDLTPEKQAKVKSLVIEFKTEKDWEHE